MSGADQSPTARTSEGAPSAGTFDEGLRTGDGIAYRVLNAPARSATPEVEAFRRLWIDIETLRPRRFEFAHAFEGYGEYAFELRERP